MQSHSESDQVDHVVDTSSGAHGVADDARPSHDDPYRNTHGAARPSLPRRLIRRLLGRKSPAEKQERDPNIYPLF